MHGAAMFVHNSGAPIWRRENSVASEMVFQTTGYICEQKNIHTNSFPITLISQMAENDKINSRCIFDKNDRFMSRTTVALKFKMRWFLDGRYSAEKRQTNVNLAPLIPDENNLQHSMTSRETIGGPIAKYPLFHRFLLNIAQF